MTTTIKSLELQYAERKKEIYNTMFLREDPKDCEVNIFPETWKTFNGKMDIVRGVALPGLSNAVASIYYSIEGCSFPKHLHKGKEHIIVLKGSLEVHHPQGSAKVGTGDYYEIEPGIAHSIDISSDTIAMIIWTGVSSQDFPKVDIRPSGCKSKVIDTITKDYEIAVAMEENGIDVRERLLQLKERIKDAQGSLCSIYKCTDVCVYQSV